MKKRRNKEKKVLNKKQMKEANDVVSNEIDLSVSDVQYDEEGNVVLPSKPTVWDLIAPDGFSIDSPDHGVMKQSLGTKTHFRPFYIPRDGFPRKMPTNWLYKLTSAGEVDILVDVHKVQTTQAVRLLQQQLTTLQSNLSYQTKKGNIDTIQETQTKIFDTEQLMSEIQFSENDLFNVSTMGVLYSDSEKKLDNFSESVEDSMASGFFKISSAWSRVKSGFKSALPLGKNYMPDTLRNLDRRSLSTYSPFISGSGRYMGGVPIGVNRITGQLEFINSFGTEEFRPQNYNMGIVGIPGSGKSLAMKLKIAREASGANVWSMIIDPEGEFSEITKRLGGINLNISEEENICINPCAVSATEIEKKIDDDELNWLEEYDESEIIDKNGKTFVRFVPVREKQAEILNFFDIIVRGKNSEEPGLNVFERNYLEDSIKYVFEEQLNISSHPDSLYQNVPMEIDGELVQSKARKPEPTISDIYNHLYSNFKNEIKAERIIAAIRPFLRDGSKPIFDGQTYFGKGMSQSLQDSRIVNFNISEMEEGFLRPIAYHVILNYIWEYFAKNPENALKKKYIYADELWQFIDNEQTVEFFEKVARRARKRNCGLCWATQDFVRILENQKSRGILSSTFTILFMQQNNIDLQKIRENFDLSEGEISIIFNNPAKGEGILRIGKSSVYLQTNPSEEELAFIESNRAVLEQMLDKKRKKKEVS
ncbi:MULTISPECIES: VirB4 family type IV secretion system protein [Oceanobacillus]|uniref:Helicase HerA central domain-containing protein n=1 Tax=Oceanobacillus kimchii TaxID=746691 RepID=A0ABQ5TQ78_9BACI|nr:DUF87 domain-containing protein [Oceanobacillus kimchii]GLO68310.1 hypothetical protein MACH08_40940 [Oceanobacillus kimchii]